MIDTPAARATIGIHAANAWASRHHDVSTADIAVSQVHVPGATALNGGIV
jgi:hypothetical protein